MARITISLPDEVLAAVDGRKGIASRSAWIAHQLRQATVAVTSSSSGAGLNVQAQPPAAQFKPVTTPARKPMVRCSVCGLESSSTQWGCPEHGYGKVRPIR